MSAFAYHYNLIIILDDVHKYFQNGTTLEDMLKIIKNTQGPMLNGLFLHNQVTEKIPVTYTRVFFLNTPINGVLLKKSTKLASGLI